MIMGVHFLGTTIAGSIVHLSLTTFLRMLLLSNRKLGSGIFFISLTLFLHNWSHCCSFLSTSKLSFPHYRLAFLGLCLWLDLFNGVLNNVFNNGGVHPHCHCLGTGPSVWSQDMTSLTTSFLTLNVLELDVNLVLLQGPSIKHGTGHSSSEEWG